MTEVLLAAIVDLVHVHWPGTEWRLQGEYRDERTYILRVKRYGSLFLTFYEDRIYFQTNTDRYHDRIPPMWIEYTDERFIARCVSWLASIAALPTGTFDFQTARRRPQLLNKGD
jgi:hypothetical protein